MSKRKPLPIVTATFDKIVGGGQAIATLDNGKKLFAWGVLPGETAQVQVTKKKKQLLEGVAIEILSASPERIAPRDKTSYLSTSPWQFMTFDAEQAYKAQLIDDAFALHHVTLPQETTVYSDGNQYEYRNKVEFSWYGESDEVGNEQLHLAFFRRGSKGKIPVDDSALLPRSMVTLAREIRDYLQSQQVHARDLKTLLIRTNQAGSTVWQLYVKEPGLQPIDDAAAATFSAQGGEVIFSNPKSPASVITERLAQYGDIVLSDTVRGVPFRYATEGFFQINLPVYERALADMASFVDTDRPVVDMYSGVGTIGLTIGGDEVTLVEVNEHAVREMKRNIAELGLNATAVLAPSEQALDYITGDKTIIVDPPRAGLHADVVEKLLEAKPERIIYLSCNPVTQARDVELLRAGYHITHTAGYNFFPRTPHIEHLVVLDAN